MQLRCDERPVDFRFSSMFLLLLTKATNKRTTSDDSLEGISSEPQTHFVLILVNTLSKMLTSDDLSKLVPEQRKMFIAGFQHCLEQSLNHVVIPGPVLSDGRENTGNEPEPRRCCVQLRLRSPVRLCRKSFASKRRNAFNTSASFSKRRTESECIARETQGSSTSSTLGSRREKIEP